MKIHFKPSSNTEGFGAGEKLDKNSIQMLLPLVLGALGILKCLDYKDQEDGTLIVEFPELESSVRNDVLNLCQTGLADWGDMTFEVIKD